MPRFFLEPERWGERPTLSEGEAHHCARVMRMQPGDEVEVFDGLGRGARARLLTVSKSEVALEIGEGTHEPEPRVKVVLGLAVLKGKAMDLAVQKAVEIGVAEIHPLLTERSIVRRENPSWERTVLEACKQCGRTRLPRVAPMVGLPDFLEDSPAEARRLIASLAPGAVPLRERLEQEPEPRELWFLIGPEGDFTPEETAAALEAGFAAVTLGSAVLRSETAAVFCLSAASFLFGGDSRACQFKKA